MLKFLAVLYGSDFTDRSDNHTSSNFKIIECDDKQELIEEVSNALIKESNIALERVCVRSDSDEYQTEDILVNEITSLFNEKYKIAQEEKRLKELQYAEERIKRIEQQELQRLAELKAKYEGRINEVVDVN